MLATLFIGTDGRRMDGVGVGGYGEKDATNVG